MFIGLENINPDSLSGAKKKQNHIADYREMLLAWRKRPLHHLLRLHHRLPERHAGVGRPRHQGHPARAAARHPSILLPDAPARQRGSRQDDGAAALDIDPDLNKFDLEHVVCDHPRMSRAEWQHAYHLAWSTYYTDEHMKTVIRRAAAGGPRVDTVAFLMVAFWAASTLYNIYPLEAGLCAPQVPARPPARPADREPARLLSAGSGDVRPEPRQDRSQVR